MLAASLTHPSSTGKLRAAGAAIACAALIAPSLLHASCIQTVYLTFDTGSQSQAAFIASTLKKHAVKATFFLANEKTVRGDYSLDPSWANYWRMLAADGHAFGTHTFDHVYVKKGHSLDQSQPLLTVKPQFGKSAGTVQQWTNAQFCSELKRVDERFYSLTGKVLSPIWRAPGGHVSQASLAAAAQCGYQHIGWQTAGVGAGFLGDELNSAAFPNAVLLNKALSHLKDGDIAVAHLGIWSRKDAWAPAVLEPLIVGLKAKGTCFATLLEHPEYGSLKPVQSIVKF